MLHRISTDTLRSEVGPQVDEMVAAVTACVHCGFCLPTCPTYVLLGEEMDSPRGRIVLMKGVLEGDLDLDRALTHVDRCLGCQACVTSCPSGVAYADLLSPFRAWAEPRRRRSVGRRFVRAMLLGALPYPGRFRALARLAGATRGLHRFVPRRLRPALDLLPTALPPHQGLPACAAARGERRARVALLAGCAQQVLAPNIHRASIDVLTENGVEVLVPRQQACCGALALHTGAAAAARRTARRNLKAFDVDVDAVVTNAAGCGSGLREYGSLFKGRPEEERARALAASAIDISAFLMDLGLRPPPPLPEPRRVAYQDPCHLAHAQAERIAPRDLLRSVPNLTLVEAQEWELCCGSAGTYNLEQPELARRLGERKVRNLLRTGADAVVTGNIGCLAQIRSHLARRGERVPVMHTIELLSEAYGNREASEAVV